MHPGTQAGAGSGRRAYSRAEVGRILRACESARQPAVDGIEPATWWRSSILLIYNVGLGLDELLTMRWEWVFLDTIHFPRGAVPINAAAIQTLARMPRLGPLCFPSNLDQAGISAAFETLCRPASVVYRGVAGLREAFAAEVLKLIESKGLPRPSVMAVVDELPQPACHGLALSGRYAQ